MSLDLMLLKADPDAASPHRLAAARTFASDPQAPRRALVELGWERATSPTNYLGTIANAPPAALDREAAHRWLEVREQQVVPSFDGTAAIAAQLDTELCGLFELDEHERLAGYDALSDVDRHRWVESFRQISSDWLEVAAATFAEASDLPQAGAWHDLVVQYHTADGGQLLICGAQDSGPYMGAAAWFESVLFVLGQVADLAGFREPTHFAVY